MSGINLKSLSEKLGLSQTTVSRALNGYPEVSERTRKRILQAADEYNYRANAGAKGLATGRTMRIGHVIPLNDDHQMVNPVFGDFISGAGDVYANAGYEMVLSVVSGEKEHDAYRDLAAKRSIDGVIVHGPRKNDPRPALLDQLGLSYVVHGRVDDYDGAYSYLDINNRRSFLRATEFMLDLGHTRLALLNGWEDFDFAARRRAGFEEALDSRGITADPSLMLEGEMTETLGHSAARRMLAQNNPPTGFVVSSTMIAMGVRRALDDLGLAISRDVSVVAHDDVLSYLDNGNALPVFTATRSSIRAAGRRCAEILIQRIENPKSDPVTELWEAELTIGQSTGRAPT